MLSQALRLFSFGVVAVSTLLSAHAADKGQEQHRFEQWKPDAGSNRFRCVARDKTGRFLHWHNGKLETWSFTEEGQPEFKRQVVVCRDANGSFIDWTTYPYPLALQVGTPVVVARSGNNCASIVGQVLPKAGLDFDPRDVVVHVEGAIGTLDVLPTSAKEYGVYGYKVDFGRSDLGGSNTFRVQLRTLQGVAVSDFVTINAPQGCVGNPTLVNFVQTLAMPEE